MPRLTLVTAGPLGRGYLERLAWRLSTVLPHAVIVAGAPLNLSPAWDPERGQYHSTRILELLARGETGEEGSRTLGVVGEDLFVPILTFVFGEALLGGPAAVFSPVRLSPTFYGLPRNKDLLLERSLKEALHELGHTFGLYHCPRDCVMRASANADEVDLKPARFCEACARALPA